MTCTKKYKYFILRYKIIWPNFLDSPCFFFQEKNINIVKLKDTFISLVTAGYIQQAPVAEMKEGSEVPTLVPVATIVPDLDARVLLQAMNSGNLAEANDSEYADSLYSFNIHNWLKLYNKWTICIPLYYSSLMKDTIKRW